MFTNTTTEKGRKRSSVGRFVEVAFQSAYLDMKREVCSIVQYRP
jgi:hypothetical protein